jgi:YesN/AraC family two-component response regulator
MSLPDMDGIELMRSMRKLVPSNPAYMCVLSGHSEPEYIERSYHAGFQNYLTKPVEPQQLKAVLQACA